MNRNATNNRKPFGANGPQARELTESELEKVSGAVGVFNEFKITKTVDSSSPAFF